MKNSKKMFILTETLLAIMVIAVAIIMVRENNGKEQDKISVIIQDSEDNQWAAFQYGLKMAAEDLEIRMFLVSTSGALTAEEEKILIEREIENGADAVIVQPAPGSEEMLRKIAARIPVILIEHTGAKDGEESRLPAVEPDNYAMGAALAEELLRDYNGKRLHGHRCGHGCQYQLVGCGPFFGRGRGSPSGNPACGGFCDCPGRQQPYYGGRICGGE